MATTEVDADATLLRTVLPSLLLPELVSCLEVQVQRHRSVRTLNIVCVGLRKRRFRITAALRSDGMVLFVC